MITHTAYHKPEVYICYVYERVYSQRRAMSSVIDDYKDDDVYQMRYNGSEVGLLGFSLSDGDRWELTYISFTDDYKVTYKVFRYIQDYMLMADKKYSTYTESSGIYKVLSKRQGWKAISDNELIFN